MSKILVAGRCEQCWAPVRLVCLDCARDMLPGDSHKKSCESKQAQEVWMCLCSPRVMVTGPGGRRKRRPKLYDQPNLFVEVTHG